MSRICEKKILFSKRILVDLRLDTLTPLTNPEWLLSAEGKYPLIYHLSFDNHLLFRWDQIC